MSLMLLGATELVVLIVDVASLQCLLRREDVQHIDLMGG